MSGLDDCFPDLETLAGLASAAQAGHRVPYVGDGSADTVVACQHGSVRLGDVLDYEGATPDTGDDVQERTCKEPGCGRAPAKGRKWCSTHASPKNRSGGDGGVQEGQQDDQKDDGGEGQP